MHIAVVGAGLSGALVVHNFVTSPYIDELTIDIYEPRERLAAGQAYQDDTHEAILNLHAMDISMIDDQPHDAIEWLSRHYPQYAQPEAFIPRAIYGEYLNDRFEEYFEHPNVTVIRDQVHDLLYNEENHTYQLITEQDDTALNRSYEAVFLAIGHPPYADYYELREAKQFILNPFPIQEKLAYIPTDARVGIIGTGLSAMDAMKFLLHERKMSQPITLFNHSDQPFKTVKFVRYLGDVVMTFNLDWIHQQQMEHEYIPLQLMVDTFFADLKDNEIDFTRLYQTYGTGSENEIRLAIAKNDPHMAKLRAYILQMTNYLPDLYHALTPSDRDLFHRRYEEVFNHFRSQIPFESIHAAIKGVDQGTVQLVVGMEHVRAESDGSFTIHTQNGNDHPVDYLINTAGFQFTLAGAVQDNSFVSNLYNREIIMANINGGIHVTWPQAQVVSPNHGIMPNLYLLGHWISKIQYGNNNIHLINIQARRTVELFLQQQFE